jgi:hypothetical protein
MEWEKVLRDCVKDNKIKELHLSKIPVLKNCANWLNVEIIGEVNHQGHSAIYKGILVRLNGNLYFVNQRTFEAIQEFIKVRKLPRIEVINGKTNK